MDRKLRIMMIGPHPDDCEIRCGGTALKFIEAGHTVKFLSTLNGCGGHQSMKPADIAARRYGETQALARYAGLTYDVWDIPDCELMADLDTRKRMTREIRAFNPDLLFCCRPNDYHADHRNCSLLVQDASYLLTVPNFCPEAPAMRRMPVIMYFYDQFKNPPFRADVTVGIDDVLDRKMEMLNCHVSQFYEWLPYTAEILDQVPTDPKERLAWLHGKPVPRTGRPLTLEELAPYHSHSHDEHREAVPAAVYRKELEARYGKEKADTIHFAEAFQLCEYGRPLTAELEKELFPF
ncbi:MAG: PIG-L family deacetylase [Oscillospiraceae bacterium]|nr:PIG-L family deacetylase [Oscillospiraceae bacterium]